MWASRLAGGPPVRWFIIIPSPVVHLGCHYLVFLVWVCKMWVLCGLWL